MIFCYIFTFLVLELGGGGLGSTFCFKLSNEAEQKHAKKGRKGGRCLILELEHFFWETIVS